MDNNIIYLKKVPFPKMFFGFVIMLAGIAVIFSSNIVFGAIFAVIGLNLISTEGSEINFIDKTLKQIIDSSGNAFRSIKNQIIHLKNIFLLINTYEVYMLLI